MNKNWKWLIGAALVVLMLFIAGCADGKDDDTSSPDAPPGTPPVTPPTEWYKPPTPAEQASALANAFNNAGFNSNLTATSNGSTITISSSSGSQTATLTTPLDVPADVTVEIDNNVTVDLSDATARASPINGIIRIKTGGKLNIADDIGNAHPSGTGTIIISNGATLIDNTAGDNAWNESTNQITFVFEAGSTSQAVMGGLGLQTVIGSGGMVDLGPGATLTAKANDYTLAGGTATINGVNTNYFTIPGDSLTVDNTAITVASSATIDMTPSGVTATFTGNAQIINTSGATVLGVPNSNTEYAPYSKTCAGGGTWN
jgi:hypothetical protein